MDKNKNNRVCPVENAGGLDNPLRKLFQNPERILKPYIKNNMTVLDLGCGPGFFSIEIAKMLGEQGKVIASDLQDGMLEIVKNKIKGTGLQSKIKLHKCKADEIGVMEKIDFVLAFYVIHEIPDQKKLFAEIKSLLKPGGKMLIVEPNFHVSKKAFEKLISRIKDSGLKIIDYPKMVFSRTILLTSEK